MAKLLFFSGSQAAISINGKLAKAAMAYAIELGAEATFINLKDFDLPLFDPDLELSSLPKGAVNLKKLLQDHDGVYIASPEYNGSFTPLLKNAIDWASRVREDDEPFLPAFTGKSYAIGATSPGGLGGIRGLVQLRMLLGGIGITVVPTQLALGDGKNAFNDDGSIKSKPLAAMLKQSVTELIKHARA